MTGEMKFRVWDKDDRKMLYFNGIFNRCPYTEKSRWVLYESIRQYHALSELMRSTELFDTNGTEIYEGDIIWTQGLLDPDVVCFGKIGFDNHWVGLSGFGLSRERCTDYSNGKQTEFFEMRWASEPSKYEVIGNIYESAELLKEDEG